MRQQVVLRGATGVLVEQHTHDVDGLLGQRHDVGRNGFAFSAQLDL